MASNDAAKDSKDVFKDVRLNFMEYWSDTFPEQSAEELRTTLENACPKIDTTTDNNCLQVDRDNSVQCAAEIHYLLKGIQGADANERKNKFSSILEILNGLSENLQRAKLDIFAGNAIPEDLLNSVKLITHDMMNIQLNVKSRCKVRWYAHLLFQIKFITNENSKSYRKLLRSFEAEWPNIISGCCNADKRYIFKLLAFVSHIDSWESEREKNFVRAPADAKIALSLYDKVDNWVFEDSNSDSKQKMTDFLRRYDKFECNKGNVGPTGGVLSKHGCKVVIQQGEVSKEIPISMEPTTEKPPDLPKGYVAMSPLLNSEFGDDENKQNINIGLTLSKYGETSNVKVMASLFSQDKNSGKWKLEGKQPLSNLTESGKPVKNVMEGEQLTKNALEGEQSVNNMPEGERPSKNATSEDEQSSKNVTESEQPTNNVKEGGITYDNVSLSARFIVAIKKMFVKDVKYSLKTDVWYSATGNFEVTCSINNKAVAQTWEDRMERNGFIRTQANINPITVLGSDKLRASLKTEESKIVVFNESHPMEEFSVEKDIVPHGKDIAHMTGYILKTPPMGEEIFSLRYRMYRKERVGKKEVEREERNKQFKMRWPDQSEGDIYYTFKNEIVPSFCPDDFNDISTWIKFVTEFLEVEVGDMDPKRSTEAQIRSHWNNTLMLWLDKVKNSGKSNMENRDERKELQTRIRLKAQEFREYRKTHNRRDIQRQ